MADPALFSSLTQSVGYVVETMCFYEAAEISPLADWSAGASAVVGFRGSRSGALQLSADINAAQSLTMQLLGKAETDDVSNEEMIGAICELGKIICGHFLSSLDPSARLVLLPPCVVRSRPPADAVRQWFSLPVGGFEVSIHFD